MLSKFSKSSISFLAPDQKSVLEEANLPVGLVDRIVGQSVLVETYPEEPPATRRVEPDDFPLLIDPSGDYWNDYRPVRVLYTDEDGQVWRFPRRWLPILQPTTEPGLDSMETVWQEVDFIETLNLPSEWDLWEINIPWSECHKAARKAVEVRVGIQPGKPATVSWLDSAGNVWRIPHDWRRRLVRLPKRDVLISQEIPAEVAEEYAERIVTVNYHPGSLCCLPDRYRFRDSSSNRWPVRIRDCTAIGFGEAHSSSN